LPLGGVSMIDAEGQPFHDPEADAALFEELRKVGEGVELVELDLNINDPEFAHAMVAKLDEYMKAA
ncbi:MAG: Tm-1-like ATP-binding domain-containing protein, partial [Actinomycetota bacterium]|nr:Tm-1-like ATP-binding domain-containing protein [Actinomycetota bacterium]